MRRFLERIVRRVDQQYYLSECPQHRRVVHIISIVGVCPIDIHRRLVHKIDYRSLSTIYIGGFSAVKNKYLCLEMVFIMAKCMFEGVSENSRRMGIRDPRYHSSIWV